MAARSANVQGWSAAPVVVRREMTRSVSCGVIVMRSIGVRLPEMRRYAGEDGLWQ